MARIAVNIYQVIPGQYWAQFYTLFYLIAATVRLVLFPWGSKGKSLQDQAAAWCRDETTHCESSHPPVCCSGFCKMTGRSRVQHPKGFLCVSPLCTLHVLEASHQEPCWHPRQSGCLTKSMVERNGPVTCWMWWSISFLDDGRLWNIHQ